MIFNLMKPVPVDEPTMYLYGREADKTVTYNGVELPELPVWDKTAYPYAYIVYKDNNSIVEGGYSARIYLCTNPVTVYYSVSMGFTFTRLKIIGERLVYGMVSDEKMLESVTEGMSAFLGDLAYLTEPNKWEYVSTETEDFETNYDSTYIWFNHDVIDTEGAVKFSATDPVTTYTNADVTINGVGYVGAVLPKLPTWDKESYPYAYMLGGKNVLGAEIDGYYANLYLCTTEVKRQSAVGLQMYFYGTAEGSKIAYYIDPTQGHTDWVRDMEKDSDYGNSDPAFVMTNTVVNDNSLIWSNHDTYWTNESPLLSASDPVPIYE